MGDWEARVGVGFRAGLTRAQGTAMLSLTQFYLLAFSLPWSELRVGASQPQGECYLQPELLSRSCLAVVMGVPRVCTLQGTPLVPFCGQCLTCLTM